MIERYVSVLFDFDGTLFDSVGAVHAATCAVFRSCGLPEPSFDDYVENFGAPYLEYYWQRGVLLSGEEIWKRYIAARDFSKAELFSDAPSVIQRLHVSGFHLGILSGQGDEIINAHCHKHDILQLFKECLCRKEEKVEPMRAFCKRYAFEPTQVVYVGDFVSDMADAQVAGCIPVGIARGHAGLRRTLKKAGARYCIDTLDELLPILCST